MIDSILTFCDEVLSNPVWFYIITLLIKIVICFAITILFIPVCVYIERRVAAWIQDRVGPNRAGIPLSIFRRFGMKSDLPFKKTLDYFGLPHDGKIANLCRFFRLDRDIPIFGLVQPMVDGRQTVPETGFHPPLRTPRILLDRPHPGACATADDGGSGSLRRRPSNLLRKRQHGGGQPQRRPPLDVRHLLPLRVRTGAGRMVIQLQIPLPGRACAPQPK